MVKEKIEEIDYFLATKEDERGNFIVYCLEEEFKLTEQELLNLIKICLVNKRAIEIGKKILAVYEKSNEFRENIVKENLRKIGIKENVKPKGEYSHPKTR